MDFYCTARNPIGSRCGKKATRYPSVQKQKLKKTYPIANFLPDLARGRALLMGPFTQNKTRIGWSLLFWIPYWFVTNSASAERVPLLFYERTLNRPPSGTSLTVPPYVKLSYLSFKLVFNFCFISETNNNHAYMCVLKRAMK